MSYIKDSLTLLFVTIAVGSLLCLMAAAAGAQTAAKVGWQIHVMQFTQMRQFTIGPPFPTRQLCEDIRFPIMIEMIDDRVECRPVVDNYNKD